MEKVVNEILAERGVKKTFFANRLGVSRQNLSQYLNIAALPKIEKIAAALNLTPLELLRRYYQTKQADTEQPTNRPPPSHRPTNK